MTPVEQITSLYIGYFGRAPDPEGLSYWVGRLADGFSLAEIAESFSVQAESQAKYPYLSNPNIASPQAFITQVYLNLFNRTPDAEGLAYWTAQLESGTDVGDFILDVISGAVTDPDQQIIENKVEVGVDFALKAANEPGFVYDNAAAAAAVEVIDGVDETEASVDAAIAETDAFFEGGVVGDVTLLTGSVDTLVGGINNDTFVGLVDTGDDTFTVADDINGGGGTDTLRLTTTGDSANEIDLSVADIATIERLELRIANEDFTGVNLSDDDGEFESVSLDFRGGEQNSDVLVENGSANTAISVENVDFDGNSLDIEFDETSDVIDAELSLTDVTDAEINIDFDEDNDGTGDTDTIAVNLDNVQGTELDFDDMETIDLNVASASNLSGVYVWSAENGDLAPQTININLEADLSIDLLDTNDDDDATINIIGSGNLDIANWGINDENLTFNAEDATGNINIAGINASAASVTASFGEGDDRLTFDTGFDFTTLEASGGAGNDTIGVGADDAAALADADLTSFETLELTEASSGDVAVDADDNGFDNLVLGADVGNNLVVEDLSGDLTIETSQTGTVTITPEGASDDLDVTLDLPGTTIALADLDVSGYTDVNFASVEDTDTVFTSLTVDNVDTLSFTGEGDIDIAGLSAAGLDTLDLTALSGSFDATGTELDAETNVLVGNLDGTSTVGLSTSAGTNVITFGADLDNTFELENFEGGVGGDVLDLGALGVDSFGDLTVVLSGTDTIITSDAFDGQITLIGVAPADLDGTANFAF